MALVSKVKPIVLCILDGWGITDNQQGNAIVAANCTNFNSLWFSYPHALLDNTGKAVGEPEGKVGNSEVGHLNLGAGRVVLQDLLRLDLAINEGTFFQNQAFLEAIDHAIKNKSKLHLMGLFGSGPVHSSLNHLHALIKLANQKSLKPNLHLFTDGRDSSPTAAIHEISDLEQILKTDNSAQIASISGRYFAMDRDNRWDRTEKAYNALCAKAGPQAYSASQAVNFYYQKNITDEFIEPTVIVGAQAKPIAPISENDAVIFFNFRPDRARQLTKAFTHDTLGTQTTTSGDKVKTFDRGPKLKNLFFVTMTNYGKNIPVSEVAFKPQEVEMPLARVLAEKNMHQLHIAETEKYAHVTYFFNGGKETPFTGEDRVLINSKKVASYDQTPEMSAAEITKEVVRRIETRLYDFAVVNYANADMVAHTGNFDATVKAVQALDFNLGILTKSVLSVGGGIVITSDHGNAEEMVNLKTGGVDTEHNANDSPCILVIDELKGKNFQLKRGMLADIAPTILSLYKISKPAQMTGRDLLS